MMSDETLISFFAWYGLAMLLWVIMIVALAAVFLRKGGNRRG